MGYLETVEETKKFESKAYAVYGNLYTYPLTIFRGDYYPVQIRCRNHGDVTVTPIEFLTSGTGCPECWKNKPMGEKQIFLILRENGIPFFREYKFPDLKFKDFLRFDFFIPSLTMCIEFQGIQHFIPVRQFGGKREFALRQIRDTMKREYCKAHHIDLVEIGYKDNVEEKMTEVIEQFHDFRQEFSYNDYE